MCKTLISRGTQKMAISHTKGGSSKCVNIINEPFPYFPSRYNNSRIFAVFKTILISISECTKLYWWLFSYIFLLNFISKYWCLSVIIYNYTIHLFSSWSTMRYIRTVKTIDIVNAQEKMNRFQMMLLFLFFTTTIWTARTSPEMMMPMPWTR